MLSMGKSTVRAINIIDDASRYYSGPRFINQSWQLVGCIVHEMPIMVLCYINYFLVGRFVLVAFHLRGFKWKSLKELSGDLMRCYRNCLIWELVKINS